jgi:hypothetical protein
MKERSDEMENTSPCTCSACRGLRHAVDEALHVLQIPRRDPDDKACDISLAVTWLKNGIAGLYDGWPNDAYDGRLGKTP